MRIACIQFAPVHKSVDENRERAVSLCEDADADLIVLPELFSTGYFFIERGDLLPHSEGIADGESMRMLQAVADDSGAAIVTGFAERDGDRLYNSAAIIRPNKPRDVYRKSHLFYREKDVFMAGDTGFRVFDCQDRKGEEYRLGVMICFDWYFPEATRALALAGADVIAHPSNLVRKDCPRSMPIRALENHVFTATANRTGAETVGDETLTFIGQSLICDPGGEVLASAGKDEETIVYADIDPASARDRQITATNDLFGDRRPELYSALH
jgi:predicted amidohydrolase